MIGVCYDKMPDVDIASSKNEYSKKIHVICAIQASLQYCFWYGDSSFRPVSSEIIDAKINEICSNFLVSQFHLAKIEIEKFLIASDITLLEERLKSIDDIFKMDLISYSETWKSFDKAYQMLLTLPSFKSDLMHKKALLAIKNSSSKAGIKTNFNVPSDYRLPQVLRYLGVLVYPDELDKMIENDEIIPSGSKYEVEIRRKTIIACNELAKLHKCTPHEIDEFLITKKNKCTNKHHLTITTNY